MGIGSITSRFSGRELARASSPNWSRKERRPDSRERESERAAEVMPMKWLFRQNKEISNRPRLE